jgi:hypothetical protein
MPLDLYYEISSTEHYLVEENFSPTPPMIIAID